MAGLKELRTRINSIASTQKITSAMKMVAAARLKRSTDMLNRSKVYSNDLSALVRTLIAELRKKEQEDKVAYIYPKVMQKQLKDDIYKLVIFSSDKGLCGSYNANILRESLRRINELLDMGKKVKVLSLGKKAGESLKRRCNNVDIEIIEFAEKGADYTETLNLMNKLQEELGNDFDVCEVIYTHFNSAISREVKNQQLLPMIIDTNEEDLHINDNLGGAVYDYEGGHLKILQDVMPLFVASEMFQKVLNSQTSEHGARMTSMDNATRNAKDMIAKLTLKYNRLRQGAITTELIEIISGAEAL